jgi:hypothetical protein
MKKLLLLLLIPLILLASCNIQPAISENTTGIVIDVESGYISYGHDSTKIILNNGEQLMMYGKHQLAVGSRYSFTYHLSDKVKFVDTFNMVDYCK